jgi:hypothetical protein
MSPYADTKLMRCESEATEPAKTSRNIAKWLSEQLGSRSVKGPSWKLIEAVLRHCVPGNQRAAETSRLQALFAATADTSPTGSPSPWSLVVATARKSPRCA